MLNIDICIMSYNRGGYLREAIISVLNQTLKAQSITVYDNGSEESVYLEIKDLIGERVKWVSAENNQKYVWNFYRALNDSTSKYVMMLHDDDRLCPDFLETQYREIENNKGMIALSCNGYLITSDGKRSGGFVDTINESGGLEVMESSGMVAIKYASNSCIPFSPAIYVREFAIDTPIREEYKKVADAVYFCELAEKGGVGYNPLPLYECRKHENQDSAYFPYEEMKRLELYFKETKFKNEADRLRLLTLLKHQDAIRVFWQVVSLIKRREIKNAFHYIAESRLNLLDYIDAIRHRLLQKLKYRMQMVAK
jgi:glycosyltransferase involved in cell wall biosynthesis